MKNLLLRLYCTPEIPFQLTDKALRSLEPLEYRSVDDCIQSLWSSPDMMAFKNHWKAEELHRTPDIILENLSDKGIKTVCRWEDGYPSLLREIAAAPPILFYQGLLPNPDSLCIGIVGARKATPIGLQAARDFSRELAEASLSIISGLADGIDTGAHEGALSSWGYTLAVLGCGLRYNYPASNLRLRQRILESGGGIVSEFPPSLRAQTWNFPRRNRIISGLSSGVIIIEAGIKSGSLITAKYALEQNRDLFAVPGSIRNPVSLGTNQLIKYGAIPVTESSDLLSHYSLASPKRISPNNTRFSLSPEEASLIQAISNEGAATVDTLALCTPFSVPQLLGHLSALEIKGLIEQWITGEYRVIK